MKLSKICPQWKNTIICICLFVKFRDEMLIESKPNIYLALWLGFTIYSPFCLFVCYICGWGSLDAISNTFSRLTTSKIYGACCQTCSFQSLLKYVCKFTVTFCMGDIRFPKLIWTLREVYLLYRAK